MKKRTHFVIIPLFLAYSALNGMISEIRLCDSLLSKSALDSNDFENIHQALFQLNYYDSEQPRHLYRRAMRKAIENNQSKYAGLYARWLADLFYELGFIDSSNHYADTAARIYKQQKDDLGYAYTANVRRLVSTLSTDFKEAYAICFEALNIFEKYQDEVGKAITYRDIGSIKLQEEKYDEALGYCLRGIDALLLNNNWYELTFTYQRTAIIYRSLQQFDLAQEYIQKSIDACRKLEGFRVNQGLMKKYWTRGYIYEASEDYELAIAYYDSSKYFANQLDYDLIDKWILNSKGEIYLKQGDHAGALEQFNQVLNFISKREIVQNSYDHFLPLYSNLVKAYEGLGNYEMAHTIMKKVTAAKDSIFQLESEKQVAELQAKYETAQKEAMIDELREDKIIQQRFLMLGGFMLGLLVFVAFMLWRNIRYRARVNETLKYQKEEIEAKSNQNELLLKEIHHRVKNNLEIVSGLLTLQSAQVKDPDVQQVMQASNNRVQAMGILHQKLYLGTNLGSIEMKDYFQNLSEGILDSFDQEEQVHIELEMGKMDLDLDTAVPIGLIVNELLTNCLKYAFPDGKNGKIRIKLEETDHDNLLLEIADNGIGMDFKTPAQGTGFGSQLVNLLAKQLRGTIKHQTQNGTVVSLKLKKSKAA